MGYIYLIEDRNNNTYKIGVTKRDPEKRLKKLQTGNSSELKIKYLYKCVEFSNIIDSLKDNPFFTKGLK